MFDASLRATYRLTRDGDHVSVAFADGVTLIGAPPLPANVLSLHVAGAVAELVVAAGASLHDMRVGDHVVVDVFDSAATPQVPSGPTAAPAQKAPPPVAAPIPLPTPPLPVPPPPAPQPVTTPASPTPSPPAQTASTPPAAEPAGDASGPIALVAQPTPVPTGTSIRGFVVPFAPETGAAAFQRGSNMLVVFDERRPVDLAGLRKDQVFGDARAEMLPEGTLIRIPLRAGVSLNLSKAPHGWRIGTTPPPGSPPASPTAIVPLLLNGRVSLPAADSGHVVVVADPATGATLLVGTQRQSGQVTVGLRRNAQFDLLPTLQGVAVEPFADSIALRVVPDGFALSADPETLAMSPILSDAVTNAAALTRRYEFPLLPADALTQRLAEQIRDAAAAPALARGPLRRMAAQSMLSLGMAAEASGVLEIAVAGDPREAASPDTIGLAAIAAILAGRPEEATDIDDPRLTGTDEIALWRAVRLALRDRASPQAAAVLAATAPLVLTYPVAMRDRLLPLVLETMAEGGEAPAAATLLAECNDLPGLEMAGAMLKQTQGDTDAALALYDALATGHDQRAAANAAVRAIELRLASGRIDVRQAADALDRRLYAWRGGRRELTLRLRIAELRQKSGDWRVALAALREAEELYPDDKPDTRARLEATFAALLRDDSVDQMPALDLVALVDENADLLPATPEGEAMQARLADRLLALDLPKRAGPVLEKLVQAAPTGVGRAGFGARLADLRLREGDAAGALAGLAESVAPDLPEGLTERRALLFAEASARRGDLGAAVAALASVGSVAADEARARLLEEAKDWPAATRALEDYAAKAVPGSGDLDDAQRRTLLRLATAAARAGDDTTLTALREQQGERMGTGPLADMFHLLTVDPVRGPADLQRASREVGLARSLPEALKTLQAK